MSAFQDLPVEKPPEPAERSALGRTLAGTLVVALLVNALAAAYLDWRPVNLGYRVIKTKWRLLAAQRHTADWLVLGDSTGNQGIVPEVLSEKLGGTTLNLCTIGALGAWNDAWMLEAYARVAGAPRHVLVVHTYQAWTHALNVEGVAQIPPRLLDTSPLDPPLQLSHGEKATLFLHRYAPLYAQDQALSLLVRTPWRVIGRRFEIDSLGFAHQDRAAPEAVKKDAAEHLRFVAEAPFALSVLNREALEALDRTAERLGIDVFVASGPVYEGLWAEPSYRAYFRSVTSVLRAFADGHPRIHLVDGDPMTFPADEMQNADHVIERAARRYTADLAAQLSAPPRDRSPLGS